MVPTIVLPCHVTHSMERNTYLEILLVLDGIDSFPCQDAKWRDTTQTQHICREVLNDSRTIRQRGHRFKGTHRQVLRDPDLVKQIFADYEEDVVFYAA